MRTYSKLQMPRLVTGVLTFRASVSIETLEQLVTDMLADEDNQYSNVHIRLGMKDKGTKKHEHRVGYQLHIDENGYHAYVEWVTNQLKLRFGNNLVAWDISPWTHIVQPLSPSAQHLATVWWNMYIRTRDAADLRATEKFLEIGLLPGNFMTRYLEAISFAHRGFELSSFSNLDTTQVEAVLEKLYGSDVAGLASAQAREMLKD